MFDFYLNGFKILFFTVYIGSLWAMIMALGYPEARHILFPCIAIGITLGMERFFESKRQYYCTLLFLFLFYCSVFWIALQGTMVTSLEIKDYIVYEAFSCFLSLLIVTVSNMVRNVKCRFIISAALMMITSIPIFLLWSYYFSTHTFLTVECCMAILQTNPSEAWQYINDHGSLMGILGLLGVFLFGGFVFYILQKATLKSLTGKLNIVLCLLLLLDFIMVYRVRENIVGTLIYDTRVYAQQYDKFLKNREQRINNLSALPDLAQKGENGVYILVIGESETRDRMGMYGYERDTTPQLDARKNDENIIVFNKAWSCANDTVSALTYALTNKNQYNDFGLEKAFSLIEVANASNYKTVWISNQAQYGLADTPITAIASEADQQLWLREKIGHLKDGRYLDIPGYYDERVLSGLDDIEYSDKMLIVIHLMGSHSSYKLRYTNAFNQFEGDDSDEYDNTVLYTDYVLGKILDKTKTIPNFQGLIYFSDHGEGIDDHVGHDNNLFTYQMTRIPMVMYFSQDFMKNRSDDYKTLFSRRNSFFTNDLIFDTMMGIMGIDDKNITDVENMITSTAYNGDAKRFYTSYGKRKIVNDPTFNN